MYFTMCRLCKGQRVVMHTGIHPIRYTYNLLTLTFQNYMSVVSQIISNYARAVLLRRSSKFF